MPRCWWASAESKYWCNHCYFQCWHTTNLQFILLFTTLFIQPVQIEPQPPLPTSFPPSFPSPTIPPPLSNFAFRLDLCVMTWPGSDRHYTQDCLQREREREREREKEGERLRRKCHTDSNNRCDKHKWMHMYFLSTTHTCTHTRSHQESIVVEPNYSFSLLAFKSHQLNKSPLTRWEQDIQYLEWSWRET